MRQIIDITPLTKLGTRWQVQIHPDDEKEMERLVRALKAAPKAEKEARKKELEGFTPRIVLAEII